MPVRYHELMNPPVTQLLTGPVLSTLLRLSLPNVLAMSIAVLVGIAETWYVGKLGTTQLAAMALVFPFSMLAQMMSSGAMGGGVSSAVSRALGAGNRDRACDLALHALAIGLVAGVVYAVVFIFFGPVFYRWLGGSGAVLAEATQFSNVLFLSAVGVWVMNALASVVRGTGNMRVSALVILGSSLAQIVIGGIFGLGVGAVPVLGIGPIPRFGLAGVAIGSIVSTAGASLFLLWYLITGQGRLTLTFKNLQLKAALLKDILKVGAIACFSPLQSVLATVVITGLIARLGTTALAGYSIGQRLEFLLIPIAFGVGVAAVPMVGMAIGAGDVARARKVAWTAGLVSAFNLTLIGLLVSAFPTLWADLFTDNPAVLAAAYQYLRWVGPCFGFFGLGLTLYFASQGSGKVLGPTLMSSLRLVVIAVVGTWLSSWVSEPAPYFMLVGAGMLIYGIATALSIRYTSWQPRQFKQP
jgi:putative MATE family efflux protein